MLPVLHSISISSMHAAIAIPARGPRTGTCTRVYVHAYYRYVHVYEQVLNIAWHPHVFIHFIIHHVLQYISIAAIAIPAACTRVRTLLVYYTWCIAIPVHFHGFIFQFIDWDSQPLSCSLAGQQAHTYRYTCTYTCSTRVQLVVVVIMLLLCRMLPS